jgi:hypothetical protein
MIESSIIDALKGDATLTSYLSKYACAPAIFTEVAPDDSKMPYLVITESLNSTDFAGVHSFTIMLDYYDYNVSRKNSKIAVERVQFLLDQMILQHERYDSIRLSFFAGSPVPEEDPRSIHYNIQFSARAGRKKWMQQL